jgi:hypothetical protein
MPQLLTNDTVRYGLIGFAFGLVTWLFVISDTPAGGGVGTPKIDLRAPLPGAGGGVDAEAR